jgi:hypothetical protein
MTFTLQTPSRVSRPRRRNQETVTVLQCDQTGFEGSQHHDCAAYDKGRPQNEMHPDRRRELHLDQSRQTDDDQTQEKYDEHGWAVARVLGGQIKTAHFTGAAHLQQPGE